MIEAMEDEINSLRRQIDEVDGQLLKLLEERTKLSLRIANARGHANQDITRELKVVERLTDEKAGTALLSNEAISVIWRCIFEYSRQAQARSLDKIKP